MTVTLPNTIIKYAVDTADSSNSGFYFYEKGPKGVFRKLGQVNDAMLTEDDTFEIDSSTAEGVVYNGRGHSDTYIIRSSLDKDVQIHDTDFGDDGSGNDIKNRIVFDSDVTVSTITQVAEGGDIARIRLILNTGAVLTVYGPDAFVYVVGDAAALDFAEFISAYGDSGITPQANRAPVFGDVPTDLSIDENADGSSVPVNVGRVTASDADAGDTLTYSILGAVDQNGGSVTGFEVDGTGLITYVGAGFSTGHDAASITSVTLTVSADDGEDHVETPVTIEVTDVDESRAMSESAVTGAQQATTTLDIDGSSPNLISIASDAVATAELVSDGEMGRFTTLGNYAGTPTWSIVGEPTVDTGTTTYGQLRIINSQTGDWRYELSEDHRQTFLELGERSGFTAGTPDSVALGAGGELRITSKTLGAGSDRTGDSIPEIRAKLVIGSESSVAAVPSSSGSNPDRVDITVTVEVDTTWQQVVDLINTGNIEGGTGTSAATPHVVASLGVPDQADNYNSVTAEDATGAAPQFDRAVLTNAEGIAQIRLTAHTPGDGDFASGDVIPKITFTLTQNGGPTVFDVNPGAGTLKITYNAAANATWADIVDAINAYDQELEFENTFGQRQISRYIRAELADTATGTAVITPRSIILTGGLGTPDTHVVEYSGLPSVIISSLVDTPVRISIDDNRFPGRASQTPEIDVTPGPGSEIVINIGTVSLEYGNEIVNAINADSVASKYVVASLPYIAENDVVGFGYGDISGRLPLLSSVPSTMLTGGRDAAGGGSRFETLTGGRDTVGNPDITLTYTIQASDGAVSDQQDFTITLTPGDDEPSITDNDFDHIIAVHTGSNVDAQGMFMGHDFDLANKDAQGNDRFIWSVEGRAATAGTGDSTQTGDFFRDQTLFTIDSNTGAWKFGTLSSQANANLRDGSGNEIIYVYDITVTDDSGLSSTRPFTITAKAANEAPSWFTGRTSKSYVTEGAVGEPDSKDGTVLFRDLDSGDSNNSLIIVVDINDTDNTLAGETTTPMSTTVGSVYHFLNTDHTNTNPLTIAGLYGDFELTRGSDARFRETMTWEYTVVEERARVLSAYRVDGDGIPVAGTFGTDTLYLRIWDDEGLGSVVTTIQATVRGVNNPPGISISPVAINAVDVNAPITLTHNNINFTDDVLSEDPANIVYENFVYTVEAVPTRAILARSGVTLARDDTFTHQDVLNGWISLTITNSIGYSGPTFTVADATDSTNKSSVARLDISVRSRDGNVATTDSADTANYGGNTGNLIIDTGDGNDQITAAQGSDFIIAGLGDDTISLDANTEDANSFGQDTVVYNFASGAIFTATDGGDGITGFKRGEDVFLLQTESDDPALATLDGFLSHVGGTDKSTSDDDLLIVQPNFEYQPDGNGGHTFLLEGVTFHFQDAGTYAGGRLAQGFVKITFDESLSWEEFLSLIEIDNVDNTTDENFNYGRGIIKDLSVLPDLFGEGSLDYVRSTTTPQPITIGGDIISVAESDSTPRTQITFLTRTDGNPNGGLTLDKSVEHGGHGGLFDLIDNVLYLKQGQSIDYEFIKTLNVRVHLSEDSDVHIPITIPVTNENDNAPVFSTGATGTGTALPENVEVDADTVIYSAIARYDATPIRWSLKQVADYELFEIDRVSGEVTFKRNTTPDFEPKPANYTFTVIAQSGQFMTEQVVTIAITDDPSDDPRPVIADTVGGTIIDDDRTRDDNKPASITDNFTPAPTSGRIDSWRVGDGIPNYGTLTFTPVTPGSKQWQWTFDLNDAGVAKINELDENDEPVNVTFEIIAVNTGGSSDPATLTIMLEGIRDIEDDALSPTVEDLQSESYIFLPASGQVVATRDGGTLAADSIKYGVGSTEGFASNAIDRHTITNTFGRFEIDANDGSWTYTVTESNSNLPVSQDLSVYVAVRHDNRFEVDTQTIKIPLTVNRATTNFTNNLASDSNDDEFFIGRFGSGGPDTIRTGEGHNGVYSRGGPDEIFLGTSSTAANRQNDVIYHRFSTEPPGGLGNIWQNIDGLDSSGQNRSERITDFVRNQDQFILVDIKNRNTTTEEFFLDNVGSGDNTRVYLRPTIQTSGSGIEFGGTDTRVVSINGFHLGFQGVGSSVSEIAITYHTDDRVILSTQGSAFNSDHVRTYGLNGGNTSQRIAVEKWHNYFGENEDSFQVLNELPAFISEF